MSAFLVDRAHIDLLVFAALRFEVRWQRTETQWKHGVALHLTPRVTFETAEKVGRMLWRENVRSLRFRYPDHKLRAPRYLFDANALVRLDVWLARPADRKLYAEILKAVHCYDYQSCEHDGWGKSEAFRFCAHLETVLPLKLGDTKEYEVAPWGVEDRYFAPEAVS